jgi:preprotein translocase subunit SecD
LKSQKRYKINLVAALVVSFGGLAVVIATGTSPSLGLDLRGGLGVTLTATSESGNVDPGVLQQTVDIIRSRIDALGVAEPEVSIAGSNNVLIQLPGIKDERRALEIIGSTAQLTFRQVQRQVPENTPADKKPEITKQVDASVNNERVVYPDAENPDLLYVLQPARLTGDVVTRAQPDPPGQSPDWGVSIDMNDRGADLWANLTGELACLRDQGDQVKSQIGIVLDGRVESATGPAPEVECDVGIEGGQSRISGLTQNEAKDLALVLRTGALPLTLEQSEVNKVSPTLGQDSLQAGLRAGLLGLALVMIYMLLYYRALGLVAWLGLAVFTATIYSLISLLGEAAGLSMTLAGVAGFIVSVGVTADSYIVAFERLKDEVRSGKTMRAAVERGMTRAFRTILVADFVTGSAAVILFWLAVGSVKGFALTLGLATLIDVLVAYFFTRSAVALLARTKLFTEARYIGVKRALGVEA